MLQLCIFYVKYFWGYFNLKTVMFFRHPRLKKALFNQGFNIGKCLKACQILARLIKISAAISKRDTQEYKNTDRIGVEKVY